jgi:DNA-binding NarL/FixJ family response regulator
MAVQGIAANGKEAVEAVNAPASPTRIPGFNTLSKRERETFALLATGYDNDQISEKLFVAPQTVRNQVSAIYDKLGVKDRFEIIRLANRK